MQAHDSDCLPPSFCKFCLEFDSYSAYLRKAELIERLNHATLKELQERKDALFKTTQSQAKAISHFEKAGKDFSNRRSYVRRKSLQLEEQILDLEASISKLRFRFERLAAMFERRAGIGMLEKNENLKSSKSESGLRGLGGLRRGWRRGL